MARNRGRRATGPGQEETELYDRITKIETEILALIQKLKKQAKLGHCQHLKFENPNAEPYDSKLNYYDRFWKLFLVNHIGTVHLARLQRRIASFTRHLNSIDALFEERNHLLDPYRKNRARQRTQDPQDPLFCQNCQRPCRNRAELGAHLRREHRHERGTGVAQAENEAIYEEEENPESAS